MGERSRVVIDLAKHTHTAQELSKFISRVLLDEQVSTVPKATFVDH